VGIYVTVHGIGNFWPGSISKSTFAGYLGCTRGEIVEFSYEPLFDGNLRRQWWHKAIVTAAMLAVGSKLPWAATVAGMAADELEDRLGDIVSYFCNKELRTEIQGELQRCLEMFPGAIVLAHSLGSLVALEAIAKMGDQRQGITLILMGCPAGSRWLGALVRRCLAVKSSATIGCRLICNIWGDHDPLAGPIQGFGIRPENQLSVRLGHDWGEYVRVVGPYLKSKNIVCL
jgi:hypothetical protein